MSLFAAHSQNVFGLIFGIEVIFLELTGTGRSLFGGWLLTSEANLFSPLGLELW